MSQRHNQISNAILVMWFSLSKHLPGYIVQNNTIREAGESRCPFYCISYAGTRHSVLRKPHWEKRELMGQKLLPILPASEPCALDARSQQPHWGRSSGWAASLAQQHDALPKTALQSSARCTAWHQPPGMGKAKARGMSVLEVLPKGKRSSWGKIRSFIMYSHCPRPNSYQAVQPH